MIKLRILSILKEEISSLIDIKNENNRFILDIAIESMSNCSKLSIFDEELSCFNKSKLLALDIATAFYMLDDTSKKKILKRMIPYLLECNIVVDKEFKNIVYDFYYPHKKVYQDIDNTTNFNNNNNNLDNYNPHDISSKKSANSIGISSKGCGYACLWKSYPYLCNYVEFMGGCYILRLYNYHKSINNLDLLFNKKNVVLMKTKEDFDFFVENKIIFEKNETQPNPSTQQTNAQQNNTTKTFMEDLLETLLLSKEKTENTYINELMYKRIKETEEFLLSFGKDPTKTNILRWIMKFKKEYNQY